MTRSHHFSSRFRPYLPFALLITLLAVLWFAGGASRADVLGQFLTRATAWIVLVVFVLFARRPQSVPAPAVAFFVLAAILLAAIQLIPLPPSVWLALPGREVLGSAALVSGQEQPWRPISISPSATLNALSSLIVPLVTLVLMGSLKQEHHWRVVKILLGMITACSLVGLVQFTGAGFDHPLINDVRGMVSGTFANRNHFALFASIGCVLAPMWAFREQGAVRWRGPVAVALLLFFGLLILAAGSRMGLFLGVAGTVLGLISVRRRILAEIRRLPPKLAIGLVATALFVLVGAILLSVSLNRAASLDRAVSMEIHDDLRARALPVVLDMTKGYFPIGSGFGTFDPVYRMHEPDELLRRTYFNHAHNDLLEVVLDGGIVALLLLIAGIGWWAWKSWNAWRTKDGSGSLLPQLGSAILLLVIIASATDYPARTPMIMAVMVIAGVWLARSEEIQNIRRDNSR